MQTKVMHLVRQICDAPSTNCGSRNKSALARQLLDIANVPQNANIQKIHLDWNNQIEILFLVPNDNCYYSLYAGCYNGKFYFGLAVIGILNENRFDFNKFDFISEDIPLDIDYFTKANAETKRETERKVYAQIQSEIDDIQQTNDSLIAWLHSGI